MKIALIGAGMVGSRILQEALDRGHSVTVIVRHPEKVQVQNAHLTVEQGDALDADQLTDLVRGHDAIISAYAVNWVDPSSFPNYSKAAQSILDSAERADVRRVLNVGGAGSLEVAPGVQFVDTPEFPEQYRAASNEQRNSLEVFRKNQTIDWTFVTPAVVIAPGTRTGKFRLGNDNPIFDANGQSFISAEDFAIAVLDELEHPQHIRQRFTLAY